MPWLKVEDKSGTSLAKVNPGCTSSGVRDVLRTECRDARICNITPQKATALMRGQEQTHECRVGCTLIRLGRRERHGKEA